MRPFHLLFILVPIAGILFSFETPAMRVATTAYFLMVSGFLLRKQNSGLHSKLMLAAMALDLILVLVLQVQRNAVATAMSFSLNPWQQAHIAVSTLAVVLYFPLMYLGFRHLKNLPILPQRRKWHRNLGIVTFILRSLGFLLMFSMLGMHPR